MFEELGLNVARQPDNAANPRPDNRTGWLEGETPDIVEELLAQDAPGEAIELSVRLWDPSTQLRYRAKGSVPARPDGAPNRMPVGQGSQ
jgi:biotin synthase